MKRENLCGEWTIHSKIQKLILAPKKLAENILKYHLLYHDKNLFWSCIPEFESMGRVFRNCRFIFNPVYVTYTKFIT